MDYLTVGHAVSEWKRIHGNSDPRLLLDRYFCGYIFVDDNKSKNDYLEMEDWCKVAIGEENYARIFNRFWFTSESELTMFRIVWTGNKLGI